MSSTRVPFAVATICVLSALFAASDAGTVLGIDKPMPSMPTRFNSDVLITVATFNPKVPYASTKARMWGSEEKQHMRLTAVDGSVSHDFSDRAKNVLYEVAADETCVKRPMDEYVDLLIPLTQCGHEYECAYNGQEMMDGVMCDTWTATQVESKNVSVVYSQHEGTMLAVRLMYTTDLDDPTTAPLQSMKLTYSNLETVCDDKDVTAPAQCTALAALRGL